jgi:hypothetical protein
MAKDEALQKIDAAALLKKAKNLLTQAQNGSAVAAEIKDAGSNSVFGRIIHEVTTLNNTMAAARHYYSNIKEVCLGIYQYALPVVHVAEKIVKPLWHGYHWLLDKTDHTAYESKWKKGLAKVGRGLVLGMTLVVGVQGIPAMVGGDYARSAVETVITEPIYDATRMALFYHNKETLFLNHTTEIDHDKGLFSVRGCKVTENCDTENAVYFRVKPSFMNSAWNLVTKGNPFFIPDQVVSSITPGVNRCEVISYGARWRVMRYAQAYPDMLDAKCTPITVNDAFTKSATPDKPNTHITQQQAPVPAAPVQHINAPHQ